MPESERIPGEDAADRDSDIPEGPTADSGNADAAPHSAKSIFLDVSELAPEQREQFLQARCRNDPGLRRDVDALLKAHGLAGAFLGVPTQTAHTVNETAGDRIGRYKIRERIGEGGCGVVYVAEQEQPVRRRVALKIIKLGMDTKSVIARFEAERQALAMMDHPNIAKVLDAGSTETGRPYFVMELVRGIRITEYCDQNKLPTRGTAGIVHPGLPRGSARASEGNHPSGHQAVEHSGDPA